MQTLYETTRNVAEAHFEAITIEDVGLVSISVLSACPPYLHNMLSCVFPTKTMPAGGCMLHLAVKR